MKRFLWPLILFLFLYTPLLAQKALIYYEGWALYVIEYYTYDFQSLINHDMGENPVCIITDSIFLSFLDNKIETAEKCTQYEECSDAISKPTAMIQVVYVKDRYCYYTLSLTSGWEGPPNSLVIDGKSYIPDAELEEVIVEIVKYCLVNKNPLSTNHIHKILNGELKTKIPYWPFY